MSRRTWLTRWSLALTLGGAALAAGCGEPASASKGKAGGPPGGGKGPPPAKVAIAEIRSGALTARRTFLGYTAPLQATTLAAGVAGTVDEVLVRAGDPVEAGAEVVRLDRDLIDPRVAAARAESARARAELAQARRELARAQKLAHPVITDAERERFESRVEVLKAQVNARDAAERQLAAERARHTIAAPFAGTISRRMVEPGMWVNPGQALMAVVSSGALQIEVDVDQSVVARISPGDTARVADRDIELVVKGVVPALDEATRTARIRLEPAKPTPELLPGAPVQVTFSYRTASGLVVSRDALVRGPSGVRLVKVTDGKALPVPIRVQAAAEGDALVAGEGLTVGDTIIVRGNERVRPGQPVQVIE